MHLNALTSTIQESPVLTKAPHHFELFQASANPPLYMAISIQQTLWQFGIQSLLVIENNLSKFHLPSFLGWKCHITYKRQGCFTFFSQYTTNMWVSTYCCSFIYLSWSYNSQVTPVCVLHREKRGKRVFPNVFNMVFPTSPFRLESSLQVFDDVT